MLLSKGGAQGSSNAASLQQQFLAQQEEGIMPLLLRELTAHRSGQSEACCVAHCAWHKSTVTA